MVKRKELNPFQKKLLETIERALNSDDKKNKEYIGFDFPCFNDSCPMKNGMRVNALAWKTSKKEYKIFCETCGQDETFTKDEFKKLKSKIDHEVALHNMEEQNKQADFEN